ncbi:MAG: CPCC family cysteine-rich protein [Bifidobacteriaceae bacterium]|nr:hypothetical protein [Bifidobacteriaceae bacterium]MEE0940780.1 CPCC family cysteine-rich protein [Bifidobacteriaceae bacterium]
MKNNTYQPMECPVCGDFYFSELQEDDDIDFLQCLRCGWQYDYEQAVNPNLKQGKNKQSVNECRALFEKLIAENPDYDYSEANCPAAKSHKCPVCKEHMFKNSDSFEICPVCDWVDDGLMESEPDSWEGTSNPLCLNDFRKRYLKNKQASR